MKYGSLMNRLKVQKFYQKKVVLKKKQRQHRRNRVNRGNKRTKGKIKGLQAELECKQDLIMQEESKTFEIFLGLFNQRLSALHELIFKR